MIPAYTKPVRFSQLLRDIRIESKVAKLSDDVKYALSAVINVRAGTRLSFDCVKRHTITVSEMERIDIELTRLGIPVHGGKL